MRFSVSPPSSRRRWPCQFRIPRQQIPGYGRQYNGGRTCVPSFHTPDFHNSLLRLRNQYSSPIPLNGFLRLRSKPTLHNTSPLTEIQGLPRRPYLGHNLHILEKCIPSCGISGRVDRPFDQTAVVVCWVRGCHGYCGLSCT